MKVYLDEQNICHADNKDGYIEAEHTFFDAVPKCAFECYRYLPEFEFIQCIDSQTESGISRQHTIDDEVIKDVITFLPDEAALERTELFPYWNQGEEYALDFRVQYNGLLYKCVQAHKAQENWTPDITPALWTGVSIDEWPEWILPTGAQDAYNTGDKVTHNSKHWISDIDSNVWEPGVYGWTEAN